MFVYLSLKKDESRKSGREEELGPHDVSRRSLFHTIDNHNFSDITILLLLDA
jgi:hypothetical protein